MSPPPRRSSLGMLLRRSKSTDLKKQQARELELQRQRDASIPKSPPRLPVLYNGAPAPQLQTFGGDAHPDSPSSLRQKRLLVDHPAPLYGARTLCREHRSSTHPQRRLGSVRPHREHDAPRPLTAMLAAPSVPSTALEGSGEGRTPPLQVGSSRASSSLLLSPRHQPLVANHLPLCSILVVGTRNSGKTSFLEFLKTALAPKKRSKSALDQDELEAKLQPSGNFLPSYLETEIDGERIGLTLWDSEGLEKNVVDPAAPRDVGSSWRASSRRPSPRR